jgi:FtsP/CotA-like multicopper oxidase with cupredoxin domain
MKHLLSRRGFLAASSASLLAPSLPTPALASPNRRSLLATTRTLDIDGRAATVFGLLNETGQAGLWFDEGERFSVRLDNETGQSTLIHWHGQIPPNGQDGVPDMPAPLLRPGEAREYDYATAPGTHWMHAHIPSHEMQLLAAPLIVRRTDEIAEDRQEVAMFLHDFSLRSPEEIFDELGVVADDGHGMGGMSGMSMGGMSGMMDHGSMGGMDLNDIEFDAYLANDRTLNDPEVVSVEAGGRVRLRIINAAAATVFWIDTGSLAAEAVAVDGQPIVPVRGTRWGLAMAQRIDLLIDLPAGSGAWPILARREGATEQTGIVLATPGAEVRKIAGKADATAPAFDLDLSQEAMFQAGSPLAARSMDRGYMVMLGGSMMPYQWSIDGQVWPDHLPINCKSGERVEIMFHNMSMMGHPMHLHGHHFQVVGLNGRALAGALRDTVYVPPMTSVTIAFDAGESADWMLHCHHMAHLQSGMMTVLSVA